MPGGDQHGAPSLRRCELSKKVATVFHLTWNEGLSAVFPAQVLRPMATLNGRHNVALLVGAALGELFRKGSRAAWSRQLELAQAGFGLKLTRFPTLPSRFRWGSVDEIVAASLLTRRIPRDDAVILHCRGRRATEVGLAVRARRSNTRVIFDCRGWEGPELLYARGFRSAVEAPPSLVAMAEKIEEHQRRAAVDADAVIVVSNAMKQIACSAWTIAADKTSVVPCCTDLNGDPDAKRDGTRRRLELSDRFVIVYCGSITPYQMIDETLDLFRKIRGVRPNALFLGITKSCERMEALIRAKGIAREDYRVIAAPHTEVAELLTGGDLAVLLRDRSRVNQVASPVKAAEYLAAGLPIVLTDGVGDYSELVRSKGLGCVASDVSCAGLDWDRIVSFLDKSRSEWGAIRKLCVEVAADMFGWGSGTKELDRIYRQLSGDNGVRVAPARSERVLTSPRRAL